MYFLIIFLPKWLKKVQLYYNLIETATNLWKIYRHLYVNYIVKFKHGDIRKHEVF